MYFDNLETCRIRAGLRIVELAKLADLDRATIRKVEKHHPVTAETLAKIINALNTVYLQKVGRVVEFDEEVTATSRYGGR